jgi:hypothetical protein
LFAHSVRRKLVQRVIHVYDNDTGPDVKAVTQPHERCFDKVYMHTTVMSDVEGVLVLEMSLRVGA